MTVIVTVPEAEEEAEAPQVEEETADPGAVE